MGAGFLSLVNNISVSCILVFALIACKRDEPEPEKEGKSQLSEEASERYRLVTETRDELDDWFEFYNLYAEADTLFKLREVWETALLTTPVAPEWQQLYKKHRKFFIPSPDERKVLDIYTFNHNLDPERRRKTDTAPTSPDSEAAIVDTEKGERVRLMFCGNVCQFHDAWWRNPDEIIVVGLIQGFDHKTLYPAIWHINTYTHSVEQFTATIPANPDKKKNYLKDEVFD